MAQTKPAMTKEASIPGPAFCAASAVSTKMPVPMTAPIPSRVSWKGPSERCRPFFSAVAMMASSDLTRSNSMTTPAKLRGYCDRGGAFRLGLDQSPDTCLANLPVLQFARGLHIILCQPRETRFGKIRAAGVAQQDQRVQGFEPGHQPLSQGTLVTHVTHQNDVVRHCAS